MPEKPEEPQRESLPPIEDPPQRRPTAAESTPGGVGAPLGTETYETEALPALDALLQTNFMEVLPGTRPMVGPHAETHMAHGDDEVHSFDTISVYDFILMRKGHEEDTGRALQDEITAPSVPTTSVPEGGSYATKGVPLLRLESDQSTDPQRIRLDMLPREGGGRSTSFLNLYSDQSPDAQHAEMGLTGLPAVPSGVAGILSLFSHAVSIHDGTPHDHLVSLNPYNHVLELTSHGDGLRITNVNEPVLSSDATTKNYVDNLVGGVSDAPFLTLGLDADLSGEYSILETDESDLPNTDIHWKWNSASTRKMIIENVGAGIAELDLTGILSITQYIDLDELADPGAPAASVVRLFANAEHIITLDEDDKWHDLSMGGGSASVAIHAEPTISNEGGLNIKWGAGEIYDPSITGGSQMVAIPAQTVNQACAASDVTWVYYDQSDNSQLKLTATESDIDWGAGDILVARIITTHNDIIEIHQYPLDFEVVHNIMHGLSHAIEKAIFSGMIVSEHPAVNAFDVDQSAGAFVESGFRIHDVAKIESTATNITRWSHDAGDAWTSDASSQIDAANWDDDDDGAVVKGNNAARYYRSVFACDGVSIHWVYPQVEYATISQALTAPNPTLPPLLQHLPLTTALVMKGNDAALPTAGGDQWIDVRPLIGSVGTGGTITSHLNLADIGADSHHVAFVQGDADALYDVLGGLATHEVLDTGVHGAGASTLATAADIGTHAGDDDAHHALVTIHADGAHSIAAQVLQAVLAANGQTGHMSGAMFDKLAGIEATADITDATNVAGAGAVMDSDIAPGEGFIRKTGAGTYTAHKSSLAAAAAPGVNDDTAAGYSVGSVWIDTTNDNTYICVDSTNGAAVWLHLNAAAGPHVLATTGPHTGTLPWGDLNKTGSSLADLATRTHASLSDAPADAHHVAYVAGTHTALGSGAPHHAAEAGESGTHTHGNLYYTEAEHGGVSPQGHHPQSHTGVSHSGNVPMVRVYNNANIATVSGVTKVLTFNSEFFDTDAMHSTASNTHRLKATTAGKYLIIGQVRWHARNTGRRDMSIRLNGVTVIGFAEIGSVADSTAFPGINVSTTYHLAAGEWVDLAVRQTSGGGINVRSEAYFSPIFEMVWLGP